MISALQAKLLTFCYRPQELDFVTQKLSDAIIKSAGEEIISMAKEGMFVAVLELKNDLKQLTDEQQVNLLKDVNFRLSELGYRTSNFSAEQTELQIYWE